MPQYKFTDHEISVEQAWEMTEFSESIYNRLEQKLDETPSIDAGLEDIIPEVNAVLEGFIDQMEKNRQDMTYLGILGAGIVIATRTQNIPIRMGEIAEIIQTVTGNDEVDESRISEWKRKIDSFEGELVSPIDASIFIDRYAAELDLSESTHQTALDIAEADGGMSGSNPSVGAARCIWVAIKQSGEDIRQKDLLNISGTTGPSIRRNIDELEAKV